MGHRNRGGKPPQQPQEPQVEILSPPEKPPGKPPGKPPTGVEKMSNSYTIKTSATLAKSEAEWSVTLDDDSHMMQYQVYANTLVAAVVAKLGEYALGLASDGNAIQTGAKKLLKEIEGC